jgi:hypothetical protein
VRVARVAFSISWLLVLASVSHGAELSRETLTAFDRYVKRTESRIERELSSNRGFLAEDFFPGEARSEAAETLASGGVFTKKLRTLREDGGEIEIPGGLVQHWVGSILVPGVRVTDVILWLQRYDDHERYFSEVERSRLLARRGDEFDVFLRFSRKKLVSVSFDTEHHVRYRKLGPGRVASESHSTRIAELQNVGTPEERERAVGDDRGFLWRLDSYWRFEETPQGVIVECESVSLSRGIPVALRWLVGRYLDSLPRESLESTLLPIRAGVAALFPLSP